MQPGTPETALKLQVNTAKGRYPATSTEKAGQGFIIQNVKLLLFFGILQIYNKMKSKLNLKGSNFQQFLIFYGEFVLHIKQVCMSFCFSQVPTSSWGCKKTKQNSLLEGSGNM